jgi:FdhD protein
MFRTPDDPERIITLPTQQWQGDVAIARDDLLAVEEPLEIRLGSEPLAVIMRTPGHDDELAAGFLHGEGIIRSRQDLQELRLWQDLAGAFAENVVTIRLASGDADAGVRSRQFYATSSCGLCGKASIEAALRLAPPLPRHANVQPALLYPLPDRLCAAQAVFARTGGLHAAGLFSLDGALLLAREDVGRHNAVDKLIGRGVLDDLLPLHDRILLVSGRISFEIVQKALVARIPLIAAISAPTSLAVETARRCNMALVGFLRDGRLNVYC